MAAWEVSNALLSPYGVGVISVKVIDDDAVVSITGATSNPYGRRRRPSSYQHPTKLHCDLGDDVAEQPQPQQYFDPFAALLGQQHVVAVAPPAAFIVPLACRGSQAASYMGGS